MHAEGRWSSSRVISQLADVMVMKGVPEHLRSDNGPEFVAKDLRKWLAKTGAKTLYIEPGSPWENGYCENFNSKTREEFLNGEIFYSMKNRGCWPNAGACTTTHPATPFVELSTAGTRGVADKQHGHGEVETAKRFPLLTPPTAAT